MSPPDPHPEGSDSVKLMAHALDRVLDHLPANIEHSEEVRREVALFIVDHFRLGEHDPDRLSDLALAMLCPTGDEVKDDELVAVAEETKIAPSE